MSCFGGIPKHGFGFVTESESMKTNLSPKAAPAVQQVLNGLVSLLVTRPRAARVRTLLLGSEYLIEVRVPQPERGRIIGAKGARYHHLEAVARALAGAEEKTASVLVLDEDTSESALPIPVRTPFSARSAGDSTAIRTVLRTTLRELSGDEPKVAVHTAGQCLVVHSILTSEAMAITAPLHDALRNIFDGVGKAHGWRQLRLSFESAPKKGATPVNRLAASLRGR